jgi:hypothetical protein
MKRAPRNVILTAVLNYVQAHAGERITLTDIRRDVTYLADQVEDQTFSQVEDHPSVTQVQVAMRRIINEEMWPVATIINGQVWRIGDNERSVFADASPAPISPASVELGPDDVDPPLANLEAMVEADVVAELNDIEEPTLPGPEPDEFEAFNEAVRSARGPDPDVRYMPLLRGTPVVGTGPAATDDDPHIGHIWEYLAGRPDGTIFMRDDRGHFYAATLKRLN